MISLRGPTSKRLFCPISNLSRCHAQNKTKILRYRFGISIHFIWCCESPWSHSMSEKNSTFIGYVDYQLEKLIDWDIKLHKMDYMRLRQHIWSTFKTFSKLTKITLVFPLSPSWGGPSWGGSPSSYLHLCSRTFILCFLLLRYTMVSNKRNQGNVTVYL